MAVLKISEMLENISFVGIGDYLETPYTVYVVCKNGRASEIACRFENTVDNEVFCNISNIFRDPGEVVVSFRNSSAIIFRDVDCKSVDVLPDEYDKLYIFADVDMQKHPESDQLISRIKDIFHNDCAVNFFYDEYRLSVAIEELI